MKCETRSCFSYVYVNAWKNKTIVITNKEIITVVNISDYRILKYKHFIAVSRIIHLGILLYIIAMFIRNKKIYSRSKCMERIFL